MTAFQVTKLSGERADLDEKTLQAFKSRLRGDLILPGQPGYDEARQVWNAMIDRRPALVVRATGAADVVAAVKFAREHDLVVSVKGGGHNISGLAVADGALLIDTSRMRGVWVDPVARTARAQAGCLLGDLDRETQVHGLAAVLGFVSETGVAGLTLGGGFGYLTRRFGWTVDNLVSCDVVTAEGKLVRASERENPDLFWALRGGGGNFGVVTSFEYKLHAVGPEIYGGAIAWHARDAPQVLELVRDIAAKAPPDLTCIAALRLAPPAPWLPKEVHGKPIVAVFACHSGAIAEGQKLLAPLQAFGSPVGDILQRRPYAQQQTLLDTANPKGRRYYWKSEYLPGLDAKLLQGVSRHLETIPSPHSAIILFQLGAALGQFPEDHSPVGNRDAKWVLNLTSSWERAQDDARNIGWTRGAWEELRQFSTGGTYVNFLNAEEGIERIQAAYGQQNLVRLAQIKATWDPTNFFRVNKNVKPATSTPRP